MAKIVKNIKWSQVLILVGLGFAWTKLGLGIAVKEIMPGAVIKTGRKYMTQAQWEAAGLGQGSADYEDWLRGQ